MTSGWDAVRRVTLTEPWSDNWVDVYLDPPMGIYIDMQKALSATIAQANAETLSALLAAMRPLVAGHNLVDRDGKPLEPWTADNMGVRLIKGIAAAIKQVQDEGEGGAPADPLPMEPGTSPGRGSPASRSRRTTGSGASRAG